MSLGRLFLSAVINSGSSTALMQYGRIDHLFKGTEQPIYEFVRDFAKKYHALPTGPTVEAHTGEPLLSISEPVDYYYDGLVRRHVEDTLKLRLQEVQNLMKADKVDTAKPLQVLAETVRQLMSEKQQKSVVDFREAYDLVIGDYSSKLGDEDELEGLELGWPSLDAMANGLVKGDVVSFVGRPATGKTWMMLHAALHGWAKAGVDPKKYKNQSRLFVSMEMGVLPIEQRLAAMYAKIPMGYLKKTQLTSAEVARLKNGLTEIKGFAHPFWVVDGNLTATVEDIWALASQLKPGAIFIDGGYLVRHPHENDRYRRVAENAELMKSMLAPLCPVVVSWQFARSAAKKNTQKGEKADLNDIGYSDVIAQVSSLAIGFFEDESVETIIRRRADILKGRHGETGRFYTNWNFKSMDFAEAVSENLSDLQI